jgi:nucleoside-diphosphate-sugar epimerase
MRILVLGGTLFLSHAVAEHAVRAGHEVVCAARGVSGAVPEGARLAVWDRAEPVPSDLAAESFDVVVDVARTPSWVRAAVAAWPGAHWVLVSTISVYADDATPGGGPGTLALHQPEPADVDLAVTPEAYGPMKLACEQAVRDGAASWTVVRPGLVVGPGDPSGRFTYWPHRLAAGGEVLAPGSRSDAVQVVDVRDLAAWLVRLGETRLAGTLDAVGPVQTLGDLLGAVAAGVGVAPALTWVDHATLEELGVEPWAGPGSLPLWLPRPSHDGMLAHDAGPARDAGLVTRPVEDTARDTLAWLRATPDAALTGLDAAREREVLDLSRRRAAATPGDAAR